MSIRIVTDSNCDLPPDIIEEYGIKVVPLYINVGQDSFLDGVEMSRAHFYEELATFPAHPTTSVPSPGQFHRVYTELAEEGATAILSIHISATLSAVTNSARLAASEVTSLPVEVHDSGNLTLGTGSQVVAAAKAAREGQAMEELLELVRDLSTRTHTIAVLDTLEFLRRSGRLSRFQSTLGSVLRLKPLIKMHDGEMGMERERTRKKAECRLIEMVAELGDLEELALVHTHAPDRAANLYRQTQHLFPDDGPPMSAEVTPVIGAHIGPGVVGFVAVQARVL